MTQLQNAMFTIIDDGLQTDDFFDIITFNSRSKFWGHQKNPMKANRDNLDLAKEFVLGLYASGGTNINDALNDALVKANSPDKTEQYAQTMILFMTDGQATTGITDTQTIITNIKVNTIERNIPIFSLAFGNDADFDLAVQVSKATGGRAQKIYEGVDAAVQLESFYDEISNPVLTDVKFKYVGDAVNQDSLTSSNAALYFNGSELIVAGKVEENSGESDFLIQIEALENSMPYKANLTIPLNKQSQSMPKPSQAQSFMKSLFAFLSIKQLLNEDNNQSYELAKAIALKNNFVTP